MATMHLSMSRDTQSESRSSRRRVVASLAPLALLYCIYMLVRFIVSGRGPEVGDRHAEWILDLEQSLHLNWEHGLQGTAIAHHWLIAFANRYYAYGLLPVLVLCAVLSAWRARAAFAWWRTAFIVSLGFAMVGFALYPLTPPRLLAAGDGFVDTLLLYGPHYYGDAAGNSLFNAYGSLPNMVNSYAAMPSMHIAWSIIAVMLFSAAFHYRRWTWPIVIFHPLFMAFAVIATGNHYVLDVFAGVAVLAAGIIGALIQNGRLRQDPLPA
ncbi:MAG TPA: phosphatase PAP2 family protein [Thermomicrobiales bacterium]|nr:phosphatase PAP2 family protein [Thermomicrobiales bacterium]